METKRWCPGCKFMVYGFCPHDMTKTLREIARSGADENVPLPSDRKIVAPALRSYLMMLPFEAQVSGLSSAMATAQPQLLFRPKRLVVPPEVGVLFLLGDLKIGISSQFAAPGNVSMSAFPPDPDPEKGFPIDNLAGMPTVQVGQCITLSVSNRDASSRHFSALMYGETLPMDYIA